MLFSFAFLGKAAGAQAGLLISGYKYALRVGLNCLKAVTIGDILSTLHALPQKGTGLPLPTCVICQTPLNAIGV